MIDKYRNRNIFWFRRDLRLEDNCALYHSLKSGSEVIPIFIFDPNILDELPRKDARVEFILNRLAFLQSELEKLGSSLLVFIGPPISIFEELKPKSLFFNHDYEPYARKRDEEIESLITEAGSKVASFKDQVIFEKDEVVKSDGSPYSVFTPYSRTWKLEFKNQKPEQYPSENLLSNLWKSKPQSLPTIEELGFKESNNTFSSPEIPVETINNYDKTRNFPGIQGTSRLGVHLRFGTISVRQLVKTAIKKNETFLNELIWREFFMQILWHHPHVVDGAFRSQYDFINWENDERKFEAWKEGKTGFPIIDAGMRELNSTGFMHNRVRMLVASFLCKNLHIDWRWGEAYFAEKLLDYELASNNGGWQWAAGTGCDAAPYFRIFNPTLQQEKYDPDGKYVKKWVPELGTDEYPDPVIDFKVSKTVALELYKSALDRQNVHN